MRWAKRNSDMGVFYMELFERTDRSFDVSKYARSSQHSKPNFPWPSVTHHSAQSSNSINRKPYNSSLTGEERIYVQKRKDYFAPDGKVW